MNLSAILTGAVQIAQAGATIAGIVNPRGPSMPPVNPAPSPLRPAVATTTAGMAAIPAIAGRALPMLASAGKIAAIAAATGLSVELVDSILKAGAPRRRRRRLLTKGDIADITTMAAVLGKGSDSFKTWLASSLNRR